MQMSYLVGRIQILQQILYWIKPVLPPTKYIADIWH